MLHGPIHSYEECNVLNIYSENYAAKRPHQSKEARSGGKTKRGKSVEFNKNTQEINVMENHDDPIPSNNKEKKLATKNCKIKSAKSAAA